MKKGLKFKVTSEELSEHCKLRSEYHDKRAADKEPQLEQLKELMDQIQQGKPDAALALSNMTKGNYRIDRDDPVGDLERDIRDHRQKARVFDFFSEHFFEEDYTLQEADLQRLEILKA